MAKSGFEVPLDYWFRNHLKNVLEFLLSEETIRKQGIFQEEYIRNILQEHDSGQVNRKFEIWTLIVFQKWYTREFYERNNGNFA